jgi:hypothetical protein
LITIEAERRMLRLEDLRFSKSNIIGHVFKVKTGRKYKINPIAFILLPKVAGEGKLLANGHKTIKEKW